MMRKILLWLVLAVVSGTVFSQELQPGLSEKSFSRHDWAKEKIAKQITWYQLKSGEMFGEPQSINVIKVDLRKHRYDVSVVYSDSARILLSEMTEQQNALAAINGTFFDMKKGGSVVFLKAGNEVVTPPNPEATALIREAAFAVGDSVMVVEFPKEEWTHWHTNFEDIMVSGPMLVKNGKRVEADSVAFNTTKHPRSAIGITYDYELLLVTADGRHRNKANGLSMNELGVLMKVLNCKNAMNLDGGGSTTLWLKNEGVVNYPSDNKAFDHEGARKVANGIAILRNK
ncbi:phosphodiester glycosidase family protein [Maribellus sp. CM-23]|uniref:phosphodiester glycosidase family protein n=1 Tax=Maribellus sp. CM-23 TaxID=2781026 RepID=UPI001F3819BD|nr:phosphodiester glycosidase family protein [Maribellus sp. CM-23]MCE4563482.1 phosphodiester glycosidase family protein [Maribellus sp. CM-23]